MSIQWIPFISGVVIGFIATHLFMEFERGFDIPIDDHANPDNVGAADTSPAQADPASGNRD